MPNSKHWVRQRATQYVTSRYRLSWLVALLCLAVLIPGVIAAQSETQDDRENASSSSAPGTALLLTIDGAIGPATMDYLNRGLEQADSDGAALVIIQMDTPGGLMTSMRAMIKAILASPVPVATYVSPAGARAASAGTYILYASHVAAMAPATHLGSATPVQMGGMPGSPADDNAPDQPSKPTDSDKEANDDTSEENSNQVPDTKRRGGSAMERKVLEDAVAYIRGLAERHDRNADWAERAVREAVNLGATQALEQNVIDVVASDIPDLLQQLDGREVVMQGGEQTLATENLTVTRADPDWRTRLLAVITDPNVAYFLMIIGFYGLIFELANPGSLVPGVIGAICLVLALFAFQVLSVNYAGLALILLGLAFIVGEAFMPSFGIMGIGGLIAFVVGSVILMDGSNQAISIPVIGGTAAVAGGLMLWTVTRFMSLRKRPVAVGIEQMAGEHAIALETFTPKGDAFHGFVQLSGERWQAVSATPVAARQTLTVERIQGLTAHVSATQTDTSSA